MSQTAKAMLYILMSCCLMACGADETSQSVQSETRPQSDSAMPPGFLDEPPPPPTSNTLVLSGGTLVGEERIADSVVVVSLGELTAWGERGAVSMPNDSVGQDMRNKWIVPGSRADLAAGELPNLAYFQAGEPTALLIFSQEPQAPWSEDYLVGTLVNGTLDLAEEN